MQDAPGGASVCDPLWSPSNSKGEVSVTLLLAPITQGKSTLKIEKRDNTQEKNTLLFGAKTIAHFEKVCLKLLPEKLSSIFHKDVCVCVCVSPKKIKKKKSSESSYTSNIFLVPNMT